MNILHVTGNFTARYGGIAQVVNGLSSAQAKLGHDVAVVASTKPSEKDELFQPEGVSLVVPMQDELSRIWNSHSFELRRDIKDCIRGTDLVHIHGIWHYPSFMGSKVAYEEKIPYVISPHGSLDPWCLAHGRTKKKIYMELIQRRQLTRARVIHAISSAESTSVRMLLPSVRINTIQNGVDIPQAASNEDKVVFERLYPWLKNRRIILFLGRIHPIKGIDIIIKAFAEVKRMHVDHTLVIAGPDEVNLKNELVKLAQKLGLYDKTFFTGYIEGTAKRCMLSAAEMLVLPSHAEVFGISILEAMAYSKPVIISSGCGFTEVATEGAGIIVKPDPHELAEAMDMVSSNMELAGEMGAKGRRLVEQNYSWDKIAGDTIEMYNEAISESRC